MKKAFVWDFNNVLMEVEKRIETTRNPHEADVLILWQDVRGGCRELAQHAKDYLNKPVVVVQHGRGATRDYLEPNNFPMLADKMCLWGPAEVNRLNQANLGKRAVVTGSPLAQWIKDIPKRVETDKKIVVFTPVITTHEEVDNVNTFWELKKIEYELAQEEIQRHRDNLKNGWHSWLVNPDYATENEIPYDLFRKNFFLVSKVTPIHDDKLYHGVVVKSNVMNTDHMTKSKILLANTDCLVGMEEGTFQLLATALGIPTVIVDGFKYLSYGGVDNYDRMEKIKTPATAFCELKDLKKTILDEMNNPSGKSQERQKVVQDEFNPYPDKDPNELIIDVASELAGGDLRKKPVLVNQEVLSVS